MHCKQRADPNEEVRYACSVKCNGNYHRAARRSAIVHVVVFHRAAPVSATVHVVIYHSGDPHRRLPEHGAGPDMCHGLKERIGYNYEMQIWVEKCVPRASCTALGFNVWFYYSLKHRILAAEGFYIVWLMLLLASARTFIHTMVAERKKEI